MTLLTSLTFSQVAIHSDYRAEQISPLVPLARVRTYIHHFRFVNKPLYLRLHSCIYGNVAQLMRAPIRKDREDLQPAFHGLPISFTRLSRVFFSFHYTLTVLVTARSMDRSISGRLGTFFLFVT
jgi:hypothetical protein